MLQKETSSPAEKRVALDIADIRQGMEHGHDEMKIRWIPTLRLLPDALTKHFSDTANIDKFMRTGVLTFRETAEQKAFRLKQKDEAKQRKAADIAGLQTKNDVCDSSATSRTTASRAAG